jgi:Kef-type K+ transport system membrane component KefB
MSATSAASSKTFGTRMVQAAALIVVFGLLLTATRLAPAEAGVVGTVAGLGFLLLAGTLTSELIELLGIPHLTGYLLAGVLAGPDVLALIDRATLAQLGPVNTLALSLIALAGGAELHIDLLRKTARSLGWSSLFQHVSVFVVSTGAFMLLAPFTPFASMGSAALWSVAVLWGVVACTRSPAALLGIIAQLRPKGPLTTFSIAFIMLSDVICIVMLTLAIAIVRPFLDPTAAFALGDLRKLFLELVGSVALGVALGLALTIYLKLIGKNRLLVLVALGVGLGELLRYIQFDALLAFLVAGFFVRNFSEQGPKLLEAVQRTGAIVFVVFFAVAGAKIDLAILAQVGTVVLLLSVVRALTTVGAARLSSRVAEDPPALRSWGWSSMISQAGFAMGIAMVVGRTFPSIAAPFTTLAVAAISINETFGPILFKIGLDRVGESGAAEPASERPADSL